MAVCEHRIRSYTSISIGSLLFYFLSEHIFTTAFDSHWGLKQIGYKILPYCEVNNQGAEKQHTYLITFTFNIANDIGNRKQKSSVPYINRICTMYSVTKKNIRFSIVFIRKESRFENETAARWNPNAICATAFCFYQNDDFKCVIHLAYGNIIIRRSAQEVYSSSSSIQLNIHKST